MIDSFQHWIYTTTPDQPAEERTNHWLALLERFGSNLDWTGYEHIRRSMWQKQLHLFSHPFYYVEYGIAQLGALQLWVNARRDPQRAVADYRAALKLGGTRPLPDLFAAAGIKFDFSETDARPPMDAVGQELAQAAALGWRIQGQDAFHDEPEPWRVRVGMRFHVRQQLFGPDPLPLADLLRVGPGLAVEAAGEDVVELVLGEAARRVGGAVDEREPLGEIGVEAELLAEAAGGPRRASTAPGAGGCSRRWSTGRRSGTCRRRGAGAASRRRR